MPLLLNCDLGEKESPDTAVEELVMPFIDQASIACGFHAGNQRLMRETLLCAKQHSVAVGVHPSYPDSIGFGRRSMDLPAAEIIPLLKYQISTLCNLAEELDTPVSYVKPHGALYNDMMVNGHLRSAVMQAIAESQQQYNRPLAFMLQATVESGTHRQEAQMFGIEVIFEAFADRCYGDNGALLSRTIEGAIHSREKMLEQVAQLKNSGTVTTDSGRQLVLEVDSICVHGDNRESVSIIEEIRRLIDK